MLTDGRTTDEKWWQEYMLNYSFPCSCSQNLSSFRFIIKQQWTIKIASPLFSIFSLAPILVGSRVHRTHFGRGPSKDHSTKVWLQLAEWFLRRRLKCEMLTDGRRTKSNGNSSHGLKARWAKNENGKKQKRLRKQKIWENYKTAEKNVKREIEKAHREYTDKFLNLNASENPKKFYSYIKSPRESKIDLRLSWQSVLGRL
jgi:hypothetical protein